MLGDSPLARIHEGRKGPAGTCFTAPHLPGDEAGARDSCDTYVESSGHAPWFRACSSAGDCAAPTEHSRCRRYAPSRQPEVRRDLRCRGRWPTVNLVLLREVLSRAAIRLTVSCGAFRRSLPSDYTLCKLGPRADPVNYMHPLKGSWPEPAETCVLRLRAGIIACAVHGVAPFVAQDRKLRLR